MFSKTSALTGLIAVAVALYILGSTAADAAPKPKEIEATELDCAKPCVDSDEIEDGTIMPEDLGFDPDTTLDQEGVEDLGFVTGDHTPDSSGAVADLQAQIDVLLGIVAGLGDFMIDDLLFLASGGRFVFVSSTAEDGDFGGVAQADAICNDLAGSALLPGTYKAWLADSGAASGPAGTFFQNPGPYALPDFSVVADNWGDVVDGSLDHAIDMSEAGGAPGALEVWTNVGGDGVGTLLDIASCEGWSVSGVTSSGVFGLTTEVSAEWTLRGFGQCNIPRAFYCFGQ